ncbi:ATP-binding protein, partial [Luminiphilus sp.]|nr:ATP-binding protein [Luminiphilus sp.]
TQLEQVFINVLGNAIDAIQSFNPDERAITLLGEMRGTQLRVTVRDTGGGLSDSDLKKIFEPFYTTKGVGKGTGLGGSISYGIISSFGGTLSAANWEKGAEITISLPIIELS